MESKNVPKAITAKLPGKDWEVKFIGKHDGRDAWEAFIPDSHTGYPFVFLMDGDKIKKEISGPEALEIVVKFVKE